MKTFCVDWKVPYKDDLNYSRVATVGPSQPVTPLRPSSAYRSGS